MTEVHPFEPFLPKNAKLLMLGTFPPAPKRWCMEWYYPNYTNDMWRIFGLCFFGDKLRFVDTDHKTYRLQELKNFLRDRGVAIFDTCLRIRRTKGTASDKDLEVVEQADLLEHRYKDSSAIHAGVQGRDRGRTAGHHALHRALSY